MPPEASMAASSRHSKKKPEHLAVPRPEYLNIQYLNIFRAAHSTKECLVEAAVDGDNLTRGLAQAL